MIDDEALAELMKAIYRFFANKVANPADAEDLAQKVFERVLERRQRGDLEHPSRFAFGVARYVLLEYWKALAKRSGEVDIEAMSIAQMGHGMSTMVNDQQWKRLVADALRTLRLDHQIVIELHYWEGKKHREIAQLLDIKLGTVSTWIRRAKEQLRKQLRQVAQEEGIDLDHVFRDLGDDEPEPDPVA